MVNTFLMYMHMDVYLREMYSMENSTIDYGLPSAMVTWHRNTHTSSSRDDNDVGL